MSEFESDLREKIDSGPTAFLYVESETLVDSKLQWKDVAREAFALSEDQTSIKILVSGIYSIGLVVNHTTPNNKREGLVSLQMDAKTIQSAASDSPSVRSCGCSWRRTNSSLMCVIRVAEGDDLSVVCSNMFVIAEMPSYLTIARLGA
ncbi:hypothetical protein P3T76_006062 [Phytophthora citrophthora]|uniref:Uncharacterized protein n=1 Tax=Phytophthora citrophthora TaxID=4793 RepID=A0AAD9LMG2_9STRA|nr:hypothetical protein P3T76_006062 [Phytophthora citrophthora]